MIHTWRGGPFFPPYQAFRHVAMAEGCRSSTTPLFIGHRHLYWLHSLCGCLCVHISPRCCPLLFSVKKSSQRFSPRHDVGLEMSSHVISGRDGKDLMVHWKILTLAGCNKRTSCEFIWFLDSSKEFGGTFDFDCDITDPCPTTPPSNPSLRVDFFTLGSHPKDRLKIGHL